MFIGAHMLGNTGRFKVESIIFNDGAFAIARGYWDGQRSLSTACRWHESDGIGYPQTFGKPQWMLLPDPSVAIEAFDNSQQPFVKLGFGKKGSPFYSLELVDEESGCGVRSFRSESPFSPIAVGDFFSAPQTEFPDELPAKQGRLVTRVQHILNEVNGAIWHSIIVTLRRPTD